MAETSDEIKVMIGVTGDTVTAQGRPSARSLSGAAYRFDIDGLRGLAIVLVVVFHVFVGRVSAGVDVFLMLGGLFFFSSQARNAYSPTGLRLWQSVVRMFRRLYPALIVVIVATVAGIMWAYPGWEWFDQFQSVASSVGYWANWFLANSGGGYNQASVSVSPLQHMWSMSAQMQIYLGSLAVIVVGAVMVKLWNRVAKGRTGFIMTTTGFTRLVSVVLVVVTVASFVFAWHMHTTDQAVNYYHTFSRFWEIGLGGLLGVVLSTGKATDVAVRTPSWVRVAAGVVGLTMILVTPYVVSGVDEFPGPWTLLPLTGAALVVLSGHGATRHVGVNWVLSTSVLRFFGRISYALYLWHWPLMIIGLRVTGAQPHSILFGSLVIAASVALAYGTYRLVETPLRQSGKPERSWPTERYTQMAFTRRRGPVKAVVAVVMVLTVAGLVALPSTYRTASEYRADMLVGEASATDYPGAAAVLYGVPTPPVKKILPDVMAFRKMLAQTQADGCYMDFPESEMVFTHNHNRSTTPCRYGDATSDRTMYLAGGSHSEQYLPALDSIGKSRGFAVVPVLKMGCALGLDPVTETNGPYPLCGSWSDQARQWIVDNPPSEGVFLVSTRPEHQIGVGPDVVPSGYLDVVHQFTEHGIRTYGVRDNPWPDIPTGVPGGAKVCVGEQRDNCDSTDVFPAVNPALSAYRGSNMVQLDLHHIFCHDGYCPAVIGNVLVYRDGQHLTNMFVNTLTTELDRQMFVEPVTQLSLDAGGPPPEARTNWQVS